MTEQDESIDAGADPLHPANGELRYELSSVLSVPACTACGALIAPEFQREHTAWHGREAP